MTGFYTLVCAVFAAYDAPVNPSPAKPLKVYADTSVFGGVFDPEFQRHSMEFFREVHRGRILLFVSILVENEISLAPARVSRSFSGTRKNYTLIKLSPEARELHQAYLSAGIVTPKSATDAFHVAVATVAGCDVIVSWNFKHIVHLDKIPLYNAVNRLNGYGEIRIHAPPEVTRHDEDQDF